MKKAYCKRNYCTISKEDINFSFIENLCYNVYYSDDVYCWVGLKNGMIQAFYLNINKHPRFKDYFYNTKELRKFKLSKIENNKL